MELKQNRTQLEQTALAAIAALVWASLWRGYIMMLRMIRAQSQRERQSGICSLSQALRTAARFQYAHCKLGLVLPHSYHRQPRRPAQAQAQARTNVHVIGLLSPPVWRAMVSSSNSTFHVMRIT